MCHHFISIVVFFVIVDGTNCEQLSKVNDEIGTYRLALVAW